MTTGQIGKENNIEKTHCEVYKTELAYVEATYGLYSEYENGRPHFTHKLCHKAAKELWEKCAVLVNLGWMHWTNKNLNTDHHD